MKFAKRALNMYHCRPAMRSAQPFSTSQAQLGGGHGKKDEKPWPKESFYKPDDFKNEIMPGVELDKTLSQDERRKESYRFRHKQTRLLLEKAENIEQYERFTRISALIAVMGIGAFMIWYNKCNTFGEEYRDIQKELEKKKVKKAVTFLPLVDLDEKPTFEGVEKPSLLAKFLSDDVWEACKDKKTMCGAGFNLVINSGVKNPDSGVGVYAPDEESYYVWEPLFGKIIDFYHGGYGKNDKHKRDLDSSKVGGNDPDPEGNYVLSTRIRVGRNLKNVPLNPAITRDQRLGVEKQVTEALGTLTGDLEGTYYPLTGMEEDVRQQLVADHFLFKKGDRFLEAAGCSRDWPEGRGIFHSDDKKFLVWVNEEDQMRIISMQKGSNIRQVFDRLGRAITTIEKKIDFAYNDHLGYIASCPTNLGTSMRASVHIKIPNVSKQPEFKEWAERHHLSVRGIHGEHSESEGGIYDISNKRRLGLSEVECVEDLRKGVEALIAWEKRLE